MKKNIFSAILMAMLVLVSFNFTSCKLDELDTNQYTNDLKILSYGPTPVARGGKLRIIGSGMNTVKTVVFPTNQEVKDIERISDEEIVVIVPRSAQPGFITVKSADKEVTSTTKITYTEPVDFAVEGGITPMSVKAGQTLTIKGTYLNLVQKVIFEKGVEVNVPNADRTVICEEIKVVVPREARTGKISLAFAATGDTLLNEVPSKEAVNIVLPSVKATINLDETKPGDVVTVIGQDFDLIETVLGPAGEELEFTMNEAKTQISFKLAENVSNGIISVVAFSGVAVPVATIGMALPKDLTVAPRTNLHAGDVITIEGKNLDVITSIDFEGATGAEIKKGRTATKIEVVMPDMAKSGSIVLHTAANLSVNAEAEAELAIETLKPFFKNFAAEAYPLGGTVTIYGKNLDLVATIAFAGGAKLEVENTDANELTFDMPVLDVETGALQLIMANGESIETAEMTVNAPEFCYVVAWPTLVDDEPLQAGSVLIITTENADHLIQVLFNNEEVQFMVNENQVYVLTPYNGKPGSKMTLVSDNGSIDYTYDLKPNTEIETVIWSGMETVEGWKGSLSALSWGGYDWSTVAEGIELRIYYQLHPAAEYDPVMRAGNGSWVALPTWKTLEGSDNDGNVPVDGSEKFMTITLTQADLDQLVSNGGLVVCGAWFIVTKVTLVEHVSLETKINDDCVKQDDREVKWVFPSLMTWNDEGRFRIQRDGPNNLGSTVKLGQVIRFYKSGTGQIQVNDANWSTITSLSDWDASAGLTVLELVVDQAILDCFNGTTGDNWSNTALILQGDGLTVEKITIE